MENTTLLSVLKTQMEWWIASNENLINNYNVELDIAQRRQNEAETRYWYAKKEGAQDENLRFKYLLNYIENKRCLYENTL